MYNKKMVTNNVSKQKTKYFGEVELSIEEDNSWADFDTVYNGQEITVSLSDFSIYGEQLKLCWDIIDKYESINEIAKKAIAEYFPQKGGIVAYYFECHFDILEEDDLLEIFGISTFEKLEIEAVVKKMGHPNLLFGINAKNKELEFSVDYMISKEYSDEILCVKMDSELNVIGFSHES